MCSYVHQKENRPSGDDDSNGAEQKACNALGNINGLEDIANGT